MAVCNGFFIQIPGGKAGQSDERRIRCTVEAGRERQRLTRLAPPAIIGAGKNPIGPVRLPESAQQAAKCVAGSIGTARQEGHPASVRGAGFRTGLPPAGGKPKKAAGANAPAAEYAVLTARA